MSSFATSTKRIGFENNGLHKWKNWEGWCGQEMIFVSEEQEQEQIAFVLINEKKE
jgi:hypothetical protein